MTASANPKSKIQNPKSNSGQVDNLAHLGLIFDVDGVLVDSPHEPTWGIALERLFATRDAWQRIRPRTTWRPDAYTQETYKQVCSGKARRDGARALLEHFRIPADEGPFLNDLCAIKQEVFVELVASARFRVFEDAVRVALQAHAEGLAQAVASSSRNATGLLEAVLLAPLCERHGLLYPFVTRAARLVDLFQADVCGRPFPHGKPAPDIFLGAAAELRLPPECCIVFEDAVSGVLAARAGGMKCVGLARLDDADALREAGADLVVSSLDQVPFERIKSLLL